MVVVTQNGPMGQSAWKVSRTEEGFLQVLARLEECRAAGDLVEVGNGLLELAFLVKWVRSDTATPPFERAHELSLEAREAFRRAGDAGGQVRALVSATVMTDPETRERMLGEAERLAQETGNENLVGLILAARARALAMTDRAKATAINREALEIFRRTGNLGGQAQCLFSLAIGDGTSEENRDFALESARIRRELGEPSEAARCVTIALMNAEELQPLGELEGLARQGLQDAQSAGDRGQEQHFYTKLAAILASTGQVEESAQFRRWADDLQEADGLTPLERWENEVDMAKTMIAMSKTQGNRDAEKGLRAELKRLKASKPKA